jgi:hypothetical protein
MALDPEKEFQRGIQALRRGRDDIAALRFVRAEREGIDVRGRILAGARPEKQKIVSGKGLQELTIDQFKEIQSMRPVQSGLGKEWNPDQSAAMRRNLQRGSGQHHTQNSPRNIIELPRNTPSTVPGSGGGGSPPPAVGFVCPFQIIIVNGEDVTPTPDLASVSANSFVWTSLTNFTATTAVTGLGSTFTPTSGRWVWLDGTVNTSTGVVTAIAVNHGTSLPARAVFSGINQSAFAYPLGQIFGSTHAFYANQHCNSNLTLIDCCISGNNAKYPFQI